MARIVAVHGITNENAGEETLGVPWRAAIRDGMRRAGVVERRLPRDRDFAVAFWGDLVRPAGRRSGGIQHLQPVDVDKGIETELLDAWLETALTTGQLPLLGEKSRSGRAPRSVQRALELLLRTPFFGGLGRVALLIGALRQVKDYLENPALRIAARQRLSTLIGPDTKVVLGHSLGSVIAYEILCQREGEQTLDFVTLGSPLGMPRLVFNRLEPSPSRGHGVFPRTVRNWTNGAAPNDLVAMVKKLAPLFGKVRDIEIITGATAHEVGPYFTGEQIGRAVAEALR